MAYSIRVSRGLVEDDGNGEIATLDIDLYTVPDEEFVGYVTMNEKLCERTGAHFYETHSFIDEEYRGKGLGIKLYDRAIREGMKRLGDVRSSLTPSDDAIRTWKSKRLNKKHKIVFENGAFCVKK